ncbi:hypothetical protein ACS86_00545 [Vibrio alginolyticus]|nr:hypothetical protein ACS86_00545 [Vibrio alginolyticus]HAS8622930.1 hypothetical protein [Vibrio vulnificus]
MRVIDQVKLYILSLMFLFFLVMLISLDTAPCKLAAGCEPLSVIDYIKANWLPCLMVFMIGVCELIRREFEYKLSGNTSDTLRVLESKSESYEHLTFLATYIIPFVGFNFDSIPRLLAYLFLLVIIGLIFIRTGMYYANPTLAIFGYKLYRITLADQNNHYEAVTAIAKDDIKQGVNVYYQFISKTVCFVRKVRE